MKKAVIFVLALAVSVAGLVVLWGCGSDDTPTGLTGTGSISVYPLPSYALAFPWAIVGPDGYTHTGAGPETLRDLAAGDYTVTWGAVAGWVTPVPTALTKTLRGGTTINFQASYVSTGGQANEGQIIIDPRPNNVGIDFPWSLTGPNDFSETGAGYVQYDDQDIGSYTITWDAYEGYLTPEPAEQTLELTVGGGITFTVEYMEQGGSALEFLPIEPGEFLMGSPRGEAGASSFEWPQHKVTLTRPFSISRTEITWDQWTSLMTGNPSYYYSICPECDGSLPIENVTWLQAIQFCNALSASEGLAPAYVVAGTSVTWDRDAAGYRLPTEAEWEFACRAGSTTSLPNGELNFQPSSCYDDATLSAVAWYCDNADQRPHEAADKLANDWGIYDMNGNVWEWVWDWSRYYDSVSMVMQRYAFMDGTFEELGTGSIIQAIPSFGEDLMLRLDEVCAQLGVSNLGMTTASVTFAYADFGGETNLKINGGTLYKGLLSGMPTDVAAGVTMSVTSSPISDGIFGTGVTGTVTLTGNVQTLLVGGTELMIEGIDIVDAAATSFALDRLADFNMKTLGLTFRPNPGGAPQVSSLGCTVVDPIGPASGSVHMLRGGSYINNPGDCRSANRSEPNRGFYSGFRVVRNGG